MKKILSLILSAFLLATSCVAPVFADNTDLPTGDNMLVIAPNPMANAAIFKDVEKDSGLETALKKLVDAGIVKGYEDGTFRPSSTLSRAEFCRMVNQLFKYTEKADYGFYDVQQTDWFYDEVLIAKKQGYIQGFEDATFRGNSKITREQVCTILNRILGLYVLYDVQISDTVSDWALSSVQAVVSNGFMSLEEGNTFRATQDITRQEFAYLFVPFCDATNPNPDGGNTPGGNEGGNTPGGNTPGGTTPGGNTPGGTTPGGSENGNTPGGTTPGGNTPGGNTPGGNTPGGNEGDDDDDEGGNTPGSNTPGGNTPGGNEGDDDDDEGGNTPGSNTPGENTPGGNTPGGNEGDDDDDEGGNTPGGNTPGGNTPGGDDGDDDDEGGNTPGGNTPGGNTPGGDDGDDDEGGNTPGGNEGGNTDPEDPDDPVIPDEPDDPVEPEEPDLTLDDVVIEEMQRLYDDLNSVKRFNHSGEFKPFYNSVKQLIKDIIDESATVLITPEYVAEAYSEATQSIKNNYNALCDSCKGQFNNIVVERAPNYKAVLVEYFYDIIPEEAFDYL